MGRVDHDRERGEQAFPGVPGEAERRQEEHADAGGVPPDPARRPGAQPGTARGGQTQGEQPQQEQETDPTGHRLLEQREVGHVPGPQARAERALQQEQDDGAAHTGPPARAHQATRPGGDPATGPHQDDERHRPDHEGGADVAREPGDRVQRPGHPVRNRLHRSRSRGDADTEGERAPCRVTVQRDHLPEHGVRPVRQIGRQGHRHRGTVDDRLLRLTGVDAPPLAVQDAQGPRVDRPRPRRTSAGPGWAHAPAVPPQPARSTRASSARLRGRRPARPCTTAVARASRTRRRTQWSICAPCHIIAG